LSDIVFAAQQTVAPSCKRSGILAPACRLGTIGFGM